MVVVVVVIVDQFNYRMVYSAIEAGQNTKKTLAKIKYAKEYFVFLSFLFVLRKCRLV